MTVDRTAVRLSPLQPPDETHLARLFVDNAVPEVTDFFDPFPLDFATARSLTHHEGRDRYWGIWLGTELVGLAMVRGWDGGYPAPAVGVFVDRGHQGQGVGKSAMLKVIEAMRTAGEPLLRARVHERNVASLRMLSAAGYRVIARGGGRVLLECEPASRPWSQESG